MNGLLKKFGGVLLGAALIFSLAAAEGCNSEKTQEYLDKVQKGYEQFQDFAAQGCKVVPAISYIAPIVDAIANTGGSATVVAAAIKASAEKWCEEVKAPSAMRTLMDSGKVMTDKGPVEVYRLE